MIKLETIRIILDHFHSEIEEYDPINIHAAHYKLGLEKAEEFIRGWFKDLGIEL